MDSVPKDVLVNNIINKNLDYDSIISLCATNKKYKNICDDENFWKNILSEKYGNDFIKSYKQQCLVLSLYDKSVNEIVESLYEEYNQISFDIPSDKYSQKDMYNLFVETISENEILNVLNSTHIHDGYYSFYLDLKLNDLSIYDMEWNMNRYNVIDLFTLIYRIIWNGIEINENFRYAYDMNKLRKIIIPYDQYLKLNNKVKIFSVNPIKDI